MHAENRLAYIDDTDCASWLTVYNGVRTGIYAGLGVEELAITTEVASYQSRSWKCSRPR
jgi:hypothetical protein